MKAENFCFWLQGFFELNGGTAQITAEQAEQIKTHLALVFKHDPAMAHPMVRPVVPPSADSLADQLRRIAEGQTKSLPRSRRGIRDGILYC